MKRFALALALTASLASGAQAVEFTHVLADKSAIKFSYKQMGVAMDGHFRQFTGKLNFDPAQPARARAALDVDLASVSTGAPEADAEMLGKSWFNTKTFPTARFESSSVKALGGNHYEVAGRLTIKGRTRDVVVPATFSPQGNTGTFAGTLTIRRSDFAIGEGAWSAFDIVANDVQIRFHLTAAGK